MLYLPEGVLVASQVAGVSAAECLASILLELSVEDVLELIEREMVSDAMTV